MPLQRFWDDRQGAIAIMCALVLLPVLLGTIGLTLDFGRAYNVESRLNAIADATALSVARQRSLNPDIREATLKSNGTQFFNNMATECKRLMITAQNVRSATTEGIHHAPEDSVTLSALNSDSVPAEPTDCTSGHEAIRSAADVDSVAASFL